MPRFLRVTQRGRWEVYPVVRWLRPGEMQAGVFLDLRTDRNVLSVYRADSDQDAVKIGVAIAATRRNFGNLDYAVIEESELTAIGITPIETEGGTPSSEVNRLHCDLNRLTMDKLIQLAHAVSRGRHRRIDTKSIRILLRSAFLSGDFDVPDKINAAMLTKLRADESGLARG